MHWYKCACTCMFHYVHFRPISQMNLSHFPQIYTFIVILNVENLQCNQKVILQTIFIIPLMINWIEIDEI